VEVGEELITLEQTSYSHKRLRFIVHLCRLVSSDPAPLASHSALVEPEQLADFLRPPPTAGSMAPLLEPAGPEARYLKAV